MTTIKLKKTVIFFFVLAFVLYGLFESLKLISGPRVTVISPSDGQTFDSPLIAVSGKTKNISAISLNDRQIFVDKAGNFNEKLMLGEGYNIMIVRANDKFGKTVEQKLQLFLNGNWPNTKSIETEATENATSTEDILESQTATTTSLQ